MAEYPFLTSLLPGLEIGHVPALGFPELKELLCTNLTQKDLEKTERLLKIIDLENLHALWVGESIDPRGNFTKAELEHALLQGMWPNQEEFPYYLKDYLEKYKTNKERAAHFPWLLSQFLDEEQANEEDDFLSQFFAFEKEWRLVIVGFRAKQLGRNIDVELQYEDPADPIIAQILAQKDAKNFEPPFEYRELKPIFDAYANSPTELQQALYAYRFQRILEIQGPNFFSIDRILSYMARLYLVERWIELDVQKGVEIIDIIEKEIK